MSYNLFLLLNANHEVEPLMDYIGKRLERTSDTSFCLDQSPDAFFAVDYLHEGTDTSLVMDIPFGAEETVVREVLDFLTYLEEYMQFQVLDPQLGKTIKSAETRQILEKWKAANLEALKTFEDGHHFLRTIEERNGKKIMIEAMRFQEETWQNHCSVAMAYGRIFDAENARRHFERAQELDPENGAILHALGVTYFNMKDYKRAKETLSHALELDPENPAAADLIKDCDSKL